MPGGASYHAIYVVLNDREFFPASLRSVYPHITGATVITSLDRDRWDRPIAADSPIDRILSRELDPEGKVNVVVAREVAEGRLRNRAMALAHPPRRARRLLRSDRERSHIVDADWFWIVDADEIYDDADVVRLKRYVEEHRGNTFMLRPTSYFRTWNWQIREPGYSAVVVRPGFWFGDLRHRYVTPWVRLFQKLAFEELVPRQHAYRAFGARLVPIEVATFHHGNYVGDRERIAAKLASSGHREETDQRWLHDVWDTWTPDTRNFHPQVPEAFPFARHVATADLPRAVVEHEWPEGWIER